VGAAVEATREEEDDEWEAATVFGFDLTKGTVDLTFADRYRAAAVPFRRIRALSAPTAGGAPRAKRHDERRASPPPTRAPPPPQPPRPATAPPLLATTGPPLLHRRVRLANLVARPALNGAIGKAISWDEAAGRYGVEIEADGARLALKPTNLNLALAEEGSEAIDAKEPARPAPARPTPAQAQALYAQLWQQREAGNADTAEATDTAAGGDGGMRIVDIDGPL